MILLISAGIFLGGFPHIHPLSTPSITGTFYGFLNNPIVMKLGGLINTIGAFLLILAIQQSNNLQRFFTSRILAFLGYISFSMYLIHAIILRSLSCYVFVNAFPVIGYNFSFLVSFFPSLALLFFASFYMSKFVDNQSVEISQSLYNKYFLSR